MTVILRGILLLISLPFLRVFSFLIRAVFVRRASVLLVTTGTPTNQSRPNDEPARVTVSPRVPTSFAQRI